MLGGCEKEDTDTIYATYTADAATEGTGDLAENHFEPVKYIRDTENRKKLRLMKRQFDFDAGKLTAKGNDVSSK